MSTRDTSAIPRDMLDPAEALMAAFKLADQRGRESILEHALSTAEDWPAPRVMAPTPTYAEESDTRAAEIERLADDVARDSDLLAGALHGGGS